MKIALFSDIHANLPALEAVLDDISSESPDMIFCLGDLVGYAPWVNKVIQLIREKNIPVIAGNYDHGVGNHSDDCGCAYKTKEDKERGALSIKFTNQVIEDSNRAYLKSLPSQFMILYHLEDGTSVRFLLVHGSPRRINEYLFEDRPDRSFLNMMEVEDVDILAFGHTHKPFHKIIGYRSKGEKSYRHAINIGSVGKPKDGDPRACYVIVELSKNSSLHEEDYIRVHFRRIDYDIEEAADAIEKSELPDAFADMLRKAY